MGYVGQRLTDHSEDGVGIGVRMGVHHPKDRNSGAGHAKTGRTQLIRVLRRSAHVVIHTPLSGISQEMSPLFPSGFHRRCADVGGVG